MKTFWDDFGKYVGVQGIMGLMLLGGFIYASVAQIVLPDAYTNLMTLVIGFYFAKNGVSVLAGLHDVLAKKGK